MIFRESEVFQQDQVPPCAPHVPHTSEADAPYYLFKNMHAQNTSIIQ